MASSVRMEEESAFAAAPLPWRQQNWAERLESSIERGANHLLSLQTEEGYWLGELEADTTHVEHVQNFWGDPLTASGAQSPDGKASYVQVYLAGNQGEALANESVGAVQDIVKADSPPAGLHVYVTGPAAISADQHLAADKAVKVVTGLTFAVIITMMLWVYRSIVTVLNDNSGDFGGLISWSLENIPDANPELPLILADPDAYALVGAEGISATMQCGSFEEMAQFFVTVLLDAEGSESTVSAVRQQLERRLGRPSITISQTISCYERY